jgi:hypothetical protein
MSLSAKRSIQMKFFKTIAAGALLLSTFGLVGCGGGVEGTYKLDKAEMKKAMEAEIAKLPEDQKGFAKLAVALIDQMDMSLELKAGGKLEMKATTPSLEEGKGAKTDTKAGEWRKEGDSIVIKADAQEIKCKPEGKKLTCDSGKKGEPSLVFLKS